MAFTALVSTVRQERARGVGSICVLKRTGLVACSRRAMATLPSGGGAAARCRGIHECVW
jgi:hypothetical protein